MQDTIAIPPSTGSGPFEHSLAIEVKYALAELQCGSDIIAMVRE
jgi:hypothetical protein